MRFCLTVALGLLVLSGTARAEIDLTRWDNSQALSADLSFAESQATANEDDQQIVPEPTMLALVGGGLLALALRLRRRR